MKTDGSWQRPPTPMPFSIPNTPDITPPYFQDQHSTAEPLFHCLQEKSGTGAAIRGCRPATEISVESTIHSPTDSATGSPSLRDATWPRNPVSPRLHPTDSDHLHPRSTTVAHSRALRVDMLVLDSTTRYRPSILQHRYLNASLYSSGPNHVPQHRVAAVILIQP